MPTPRNTRRIASLVLAWFVLLLAGATVSPIVKPQSIAFVCSGSGMKWLVHDDGSGEHPASASLDCPLCVGVLTPPPAPRTGQEFLSPLRHVVQPVPAAHVAWLTAAPLPARGPPALS